MRTFTLLTLVLMTHFSHAQSVFEWANSMGSTGNDNGQAIVTDDNGNVYTTGSFRGMVDFDPDTLSSVILTSNGAADIFIQKLDANGRLLWVKQMGGIGPTNEGNAIVIDNNGNVYTTGRFYDIADFDPGVGTTNLTSNGATDIFIQKLDANGNFLWAKSMGGTLTDGGNALALDTAGNVYITGYFQNTADFDPGTGTTTLTSTGVSDIFIQKLDPNGNFLWVKQMGGIETDIGMALKLDAAGNIYTTGHFRQMVDFDPNTGVNNLTAAGGSDIFMQKLDATGNLIWVKAMGGTSNDYGDDLVLGKNSNIHVVGRFSDTADLDPSTGVSNYTANGRSDIFIQKLDLNGDFIWAKTMGGTGYDYGEAIALDTTGHIYTTGSFSGGVDFDPGTGTTLIGASGSSDIFIQKLDPNGDFIWAQTIGGTSFDYGTNITVDAAGDIYTTGRFFATTDFDPSPGITNLTSNGNNDIFILKLSQPSFNTLPNIAPTLAKLYPNPSFNTVTIELEQAQEATITILDNQGRLAHPPLFTNQQQTTLELAHLPTGIYYITIITDKKTTSNKWIKQ